MEAKPTNILFKKSISNTTENINPMSLDEKWRILIVDDEQEVHTVTKLIFKDFVFEGKRIELLSAYSCKEAQEIINNNSDIAIILLDVVMEEDNSGLKFVKYVRDEMKNKAVRIILRTGQPGQAPEERIILEYQINDYKEKTELTSQKLITSVAAALRSYTDLQTIESNRIALRQIIEASASIFELRSMNEFISGILTQIISILGLRKDSFYSKICGFSLLKKDADLCILAATGDYYKYLNKKVSEVVPDNIRDIIEQAYNEKRNIYKENQFAIYFKNKVDSENMIYVEGFKKLTDIDIELLEIFNSNISIAFDNLYLNNQIEDTQKDVIFTLGEIAEMRSKEIGNHVKRVAEYSKILALGYGISEDEAEKLKLASSMHDIGKIAITDAILNKPDRLTPDEFDVIKTHTTIGAEMLKNTNSPIMKTAVDIVLQHHEKYDGTGYPYGLKGQEIGVLGRIVALADVFDALGTNRVYKKAWEMDKILDYIKAEKGKHFDPELVDIFIERLDQILRVRYTFYDE